MPTNTSRASYDTFITEKWPTQNYGSMGQLHVCAASGDKRYGFLYFAGMPPKGATVFTATLSVWLRDAWTGGAHTITVKRVTDTWSESKLTYTRAGAGQLATATHDVTASVTSGVDGQRVDIDVSGILSDIAAGTAWYGLRLEVSTSSTAHLKFYSSESTHTDERPQLTVVWSRPPDAPQDLAPAGGASVSLLKPTLNWVFKDPDGDEQADYQVQVGTDSTFATSDLDTGWVASSDSQLDTSLTGYAGVSGTTYWRARVKDVNGLASGWSTVASFIQTVKGALTVGNPTDGGSVEETTPPITTTLTGQAQDAIAYKLDEAQTDGTWRQVWSSGRFTAASADGTPYTHNVPAGKITKNGTDYRLTVWSYDDVDREATPGDPIYVAAQSTFTFQRSVVPDPVTALTVASQGPGALLTFSRVSEPDYFALRIDDVLKYDRLEAGDFNTGPTVSSNFLTGQNTDFEGGNGTWVNTNDGSLSHVTTPVHGGSGAMKLTATASGDMSAAHCAAGSITSQGMAVTPGQKVNGSVWLQPGSTVRSVAVGAVFYTSAGTLISPALYDTAQTEVTSVYTEITGSVIAPLTAAWCRMQFKVQSVVTSEIHYVDDATMSSETENYALIYSGAIPNQSHTFEVEAVFSDSGVLKHSQSNPVVTSTPYVQGIWIVDDSEAPYAVSDSPSLVRIDGQDSQDFTIGETSNVYYPIGRRDPVTIVDAVRGLEGTITGTIVTGPGWVSTFRWMKQPEQVGRTFRLVYGQTNLPVQLGEAHITPTPSGGGAQEYSVSVAIVQVGDFE